MRSRRDSATARAAQQPSMFPHRRLQAVSALLRRTSGALRDFARDRAVRNWRVSEDHRPATSPPKTTKRHLPSSTDNSGYVRTLRLLAALSAAPSLEAAPALAVPSLLMALTRVASMASCAPPNNGRPSATTSRRRPSSRNPEDPCRRHVSGHSGTSFTAYASHHALHGEAPPTQHPCHCESCTVVAKDVEWTATLAVALWQGEWEAKTAEQQNTETLYLNPEQPVCGATGERDGRQRASL